MEKSIADELQPWADDIARLFEEKSGQFLVVALDDTVLIYMRHLIAKKSAYKAVDVTAQRDEDPSGKIFFINLENASSMRYQALLYYYLELAQKHRCFVCLLSTSSLCLSTFEKRVRSRFQDRVFFIPYLKPVGGGLHTTIEARRQHQLMEKYGLERYTLSYLFDLFGPVHFVLILVAQKERLTAGNCCELFKKYVVSMCEIKGTSSGTVVYCYYDLLDAQVITPSGELAIDFGEFKEYAGRKSPVFIKKMLEKCK